MFKAAIAVIHILDAAGTFSATRYLFWMYMAVVASAIPGGGLPSDVASKRSPRRFCRANYPSSPPQNSKDPLTAPGGIPGRRSKEGIPQTTDMENTKVLGSASSCRLEIHAPPTVQRHRSVPH